MKPKNKYAEETALQTTYEMEELNEFFEESLTDDEIRILIKRENYDTD